MADLKQTGGRVSFAGDYTLEECIREDQGAALFTASRTTGERALVRIMPASLAGADRALATWQRARHLRHRNVVDVLDAGCAEFAGESHVYAAFEFPEEILSNAIAGGPLSEADTRDVLVSALDALRYLHGQGLVHGGVGADRIVAIGDTIKLASDSLRESDDLEGHAEDVRQLGELVKTLRGAEIGESLRTIVEHATEPDLRYRWTLAEIAGALASMPVPAVTAPMLETTEEAEPTAAPEPAAQPLALAAAETHSAVPQPDVVETPKIQPPPPPSPRRAVELSVPIGFPKWIFVGVAIVLLLILGFNIRKAPPKPAPATTIEHIAPPPATPPSATPSFPPAPARVEPQPAHAVERSMWRVVAFTYASRDEAAKKAKQINERWPAMHATVFAPGDRRRHYLVALGGRMTHEEAVKLQRKARKSGLPRDTYIQNYTE